MCVWVCVRSEDVYIGRSACVGMCMHIRQVTVCERVVQERERDVR